MSSAAVGIRTHSMEASGNDNLFGEYGDDNLIGVPGYLENCFQAVCFVLASTGTFSPEKPDGVA
jgi:hypothetical protein